MSSPADSNEPTVGLRTRLLAAVVPVTVLLIGYWASTQYFAGREATVTLEQLPERPALDASTASLGPVLDEAMAAVREAPSAENVGQLGRLYQANYFFDEAAACYRRAMELAPRAAEWPYLLSYVEQMKGGSPAAARLLDQAIELDPTYLPALLRRADKRYKAGDLAGAKADYERCLELHMNNPYARLGLGRIAADENDWQTAETHLERAVRGDSKFATAYRLLANVYEKLGKEAEQQRALATADSLPPFEPAPDPLVDGLDKLCYNTERLLTLGFRADRQRRDDEAERYYRRVLALDPDNFAANAQVGALLQQANRFEEAAPLLERALTQTPRGALRLHDIHLNLGNNYLFQGKLEEAVPHFEKTLELVPGTEAAHHGLAGCYLQLKRPADAIEQCQKALALNPDSHEAQFNWGQALLNLDRVDEAIPHFEAAARLNAMYPSADFKAGNYYYKRGQVAEARPYLERALERARASGQAHLAGQIQAMLQQ